MAKKPKDIEWRVSEVRAKARYLGTVTAPNLEEALKRAAQEFNVTGERAKRLMARPKA